VHLKVRNSLKRKAPSLLETLPERDADKSLDALPLTIGQHLPERKHRRRGGQHPKHAHQRRVTVIRRQQSADLKVADDRQVDEIFQNAGEGG
jgi:hypothetical protein